VAPATVLAPGVAEPVAGPLDVARRAAHVLLVLGGVGAAVVVLAFKLSGWQALTVLTGSMRPAIAPGQVVLTAAVPVSTVRPGEVITFARPGRAGTTTHRVVSVVPAAGGHLTVTTKGDANPGPETWRIADTGTVGRVRAVLPAVGGTLALFVAGPARPYFVGGVTALAAVLVLWWVWRPEDDDEEDEEDEEDEPHDDARAVA
jgi:signal peptidase